VTTEPTTEARRLEAWAGSVRRLVAVAPTRAVMDETGLAGGHSTPPERQAIRAAALAVVDGWLARDLGAIEDIEAEAVHAALTALYAKVADLQPPDEVNALLMVLALIDKELAR
jgi:hypothetical protein